MMKILCLLLALIMTNTACLPVAVPPETMSSAEYVTEHFNEFIEEYNKLDCDDCAATHIEYQTEIYVNDTGEMGYYLDFNGDNGFCIVTDEAVVDMYVTGDYPQLREDHEYMYDVMDGFLVKVGDEYVPYLQQNMPLEDDELVGGAKQICAITNAGEYVRKYYGSEYKLYDMRSLRNFGHKHQGELSVYITYDKNGNPLSEGNCVLTAIYSTLAHMQKNGVYSRLPTGRTTIYVSSSDKVAKAAKAQGYVPRARYVTLPTLYAKIREIAINKYGYTVNGVSAGNVANLLKDTLKAYGYTASPRASSWLAAGGQATSTTPFETTIKRNIAYNYPVIFNTYQVYGESHCITVTGYKYYRRTWRVGFAKWYQYAKLLQVADNHTKSATYFDYTAYMLSAKYVYFR